MKFLKLMIFCLSVQPVFAITKVPVNIHKPTFSTVGKNNLDSLDFLFKTEWKKPADFAKLSKQSLAFGPKAVPVLINVMKKKQYPSTNKWIAMFSLTKLMGKKSATVLSKFNRHPDWMMRLGSLKCLLFLKEKKYSANFIKLLSDPSMIVKHQALTNINVLNIKEAAPEINNLLIKLKNDKTNNHTALTDLAVLTLAKLGDKTSVRTLVDIMKKSEFKNSSPSIDYSLEMLTGKKSPKGDLSSKITFWNSTTASI